MAKDLALGIVIGGAVSATFGKAITDTSSKIDAMKKRANDSRLWQRQIGETMRLQDEFRRLHLAGDSAADGIRRKLDSNLKSLRDVGIEVGRLDRAYAQLGRTARGLDLKVAGRERLAAGQEAGRGVIGDAMKLTAAVAVPATISANYQAIIRDIAIKAGIARTQEEAAMATRIRRDAGANGIDRNELADAVNQMVAGGMDLDRALNFAPLVAKFSIGQGATTVETAKMIQALQQNAEIVDPKQMSKALEAIAYLGKEGSFESVDMARWFPVLLAEMKKIGITGQDSVTQLGAMLQVQMKTAGSSDEAANNLKNWFSKIGSGETERNYAKAGVDYQAKMREAIGKGWSTLEASFVLARAYIERVDPAKAKQLAAAAKQFNSEMDPAKRQAQMAAFAETMKTGDLFNDMQVKAALTAYMQNAELYSNLKRNAQQASGEIQKDLEARRETSKQIWSEVGQRWDDAMRSIGDALRPITDRVGEAAKGTGSGIQSAADSAPKATAAVVGIAGTVLAVRGAKALWGIGRGLFDIARGTVLARGGRGGGRACRWCGWRRRARTGCSRWGCERHWWRPARVCREHARRWRRWWRAWRSDGRWACRSSRTSRGSSGGAAREDRAGRQRGTCALRSGCAVGRKAGRRGDRPEVRPCGSRSIRRRVEHRYERSEGHPVRGHRRQSRGWRDRREGRGDDRSARRADRIGCRRRAWRGTRDVCRRQGTERHREQVLGPEARRDARECRGGRQGSEGSGKSGGRCPVRAAYRSDEHVRAGLQREDRGERYRHG
ncbi:phage tail tape measure protein [Burkholderia cepacia]|nr:phage tail tape measure protein [Burkholderia cepacia]